MMPEYPEGGVLGIINKRRESCSFVHSLFWGVAIKSLRIIMLDWQCVMQRHLNLVTKMAPVR